MAYNVDFWYISQDACQISTDFTPFTEAEEESIYMKTSDFFEMVEQFTDPDLERKSKAFDEILDMYKKSKEYEKIEGMSMWQSPYEKHIEQLIKNYLEDE